MLVAKAGTTQYELWDRLSPRHHWQLVVRTDDKQHRDRLIGIMQDKWVKYNREGTQIATSQFVMPKEGYYDAPYSSKNSDRFTVVYEHTKENDNE